MTYDKNGNLVEKVDEKKQIKYNYKEDGKLEQISKIQIGESQEQTSKYIYSPLGTVVQNDQEQVRSIYTVDYLSIANREIEVDEKGSFIKSYTYNEKGERIKASFKESENTSRTTPEEKYIKK